MPAVNLTRFKDGRYCLSFHLDGKRRRETFSKIRDAQFRKTEVERLKGKGLEVAVKGEVAVDESAHYAINQLSTKGITKPLTAVIDEYIAAQEALGSVGSIVEACTAFAQPCSEIRKTQSPVSKRCSTKM